MVFTGRNDIKTLQSVNEGRAHDAPVVVVTTDRCGIIDDYAGHIFRILDTHHDVASILTNVQLQLVSYLAAAERSRPTDGPQDRSNSVTVE